MMTMENGNSSLYGKVSCIFMWNYVIQFDKYRACAHYYGPFQIKSTKKFNKSKVSMENKTIKSTNFRDGKIMHMIGYITNVCLI